MSERDIASSRALSLSSIESFNDKFLETSSRRARDELETSPLGNFNGTLQFLFRVKSNT